MSEELKDKLDSMHRDIRDGHKSLHTRHDNLDQSHRYMHHKIDRLRAGLAALFHGDSEAFMNWWRNK